MGIHVALRPDSYTLTLGNCSLRCPTSCIHAVVTLSHTWERGCGPEHHWPFSCFRSTRFRILDLDPDAYTASQEF